ncbi:MAG: glycosyltransferase family 2 protein [Proteobacteria bacterium]|nr:glycosyltransferase family 2 protein [Pseudomonadota bacterium]
MAKVSVIIPTYNLCDMLYDTIQSVINQTEKDLEIIIVDDGSIDETKNTVKQSGDSRIKYFYKENGGTSAARNYGLERASGEFIAFLDHDDLYPKNFIEKMVAALEANPEFGLAYGGLDVILKDGKTKRFSGGHQKSGNLTIDCFKKGFVYTSSSVMRKSALFDCRYDEQLKQSYEDADFFLRLSLKTKFIFVPDTSGIRREHFENLSGKVGIRPTRILVLERFYYNLGGKIIVPKKTAYKKLSHACRKVAKYYLKENMRIASISIYKKAIKYHPADIRLYIELLKAVMLRKDNCPSWCMPRPLTIPISSVAAT